MALASLEKCNRHNTELIRIIADKILEKRNSETHRPRITATPASGTEHGNDNRKKISKPNGKSGWTTSTAITVAIADQMHEPTVVTRNVSQAA